MIRYVNHYAYRSQFVPARLFETEEAARDFDREYVSLALGAMGESEFDAAMKYGDAKFEEWLAFAADETSEAKTRAWLAEREAKKQPTTDGPIAANNDVLIDVTAAPANYAEERAEATKSVG